MYNNYSSSEELTESQNFEKFMNAKDSDDEEKALHGKKKGLTGFGAAKGANTKTYPTYGGPSYQSSSSYNQGGGYGTTSGYGASGGYGTGYGAYGGNAAASGGYGGGYGSGTGFGASGYGGSGYGGSGYGGSGYGGSGYGGGYGDSNPYAGVDITGYGGTSGYTGGAGTGYKDPEDDGEYDEDEEEEEPVEFDLASVKKRKEEQKAAKLAEEKKAEEERKAKEERKAYLESLAAKSAATNNKKDKNAKVTFNLGEAIGDDSDNDNNKNISHISERDDSNASSDQQARNAKNKPAASNNKKVSNILNISDDKKAEEDSDEKIVPESEDNIEEEVNETPKKYEAKKEESESGYTDDFEASSSKFGSADMGKAALKLAKSRTNEFEDSSHLSESKDARYDDKLTDRINQEPKAETKPAIYTDAKTTTYSKPSAQQAQPAGASSLTQHYETRIAKDYVYESLLKDEKNKIDRLEAQLSLGGEQVRNVQQLIAEKDVTIHKLITQNQTLQKDLDIWQYEAQDFEKKNKIYEVENEDLQKRIEVLEAKLLESESQKRILAKDNEDKTKAIKERKTVLEKEFEAKIISELKAQQENEKDLLMMRIEELQDDNKRYQEEIEKFREDARLYKTNFRQKAESDQESKRLKQEIMILELKLKDRDQNKAAGAAKRTTEVVASSAPTRDNIAPTSSGVPELDKEIQMQELLIKGFQKENEKLIIENKSLKKEIEDLNSRLYDENKKVTEIKTKLVHNTDNVLITDKEIDIETKKMLGSENLISKDQLKIDRERIIQLQRDLQAQEEVFKQREIEMKFELDRLRAQKMNLEAKSGGVDLSNMKQQDESYKQLQATLDSEKQRYEAELRDLRGKLKWYIENQDSIAGKEDIIKQKNDAIRKLEEDITKILSDPNANLDAKSKHFAKVSTEDKKRIKQLERDVENLEENLKKRNPGVYDKLKSEKDESSLVKELKQTVKKLQDEKIVTEKEYDTKLNDLRQKFDKMKLGYENRGNEQVQAGATQAKNATANLENVEVLKTRIKELEKEVEDAKKYYLKKAQSLKDSKKGGKVIEKDLKSTKETAKSSTKKVQFNVKEDSEISSDKENNQDSSNTSEYEKINLLNKLTNLPSTPVYALLTGFQNYRTSAFEAFRSNNTTQASNIKSEFTRLVNDTLADYPQRDQIVQKVKKVDELIVTEHNDPRYTLDTIQAAIYDLVWNEMKKDRSNMTISNFKSSTKMNNFFGGSDDNGDVSGRKLIVLEETLKKKEEELANAQQRLTTLTSDNARLEKDKSNLELIIQRLPKNPKALDYATMEKKLEILERNYRENELELKNAFRKAYGRDPFGTVSEDEINKIKANYENEIAHLRGTIERKNQEISTFRQQMEVILKELDRLRKSRA